jgi:hypothetical protein
MSRYFTFFPKTVYDNQTVVDLTKRVQIIEDLRSNPYGLLPYTVKDDERPEDVSLYYYGDQNKVWMIYLANNIVDPYTQWPMSTENLDKTIIAKYSAQANTSGYGVLTWAQNTNLTDNIVHYSNTSDPSIKITPTSYDRGLQYGTYISTEWTPVRIYEYEFGLNEDRRAIFLINAVYANQLETDLKKVLSE